MSEKIYVRGMFLKEKNFQSGSMLTVGISKKDFLEHIESLPANERGYINLCIGARREVSESGLTHSCWVDTWRPNQDRQAQERSAPPPKSSPPSERQERNDTNDDGSEIPF